MSVPHAEFHEVWWIYSPMNGREWAGLRVGHFRKTVSGDLIVYIAGEIDQRRIGMRIWSSIQQTELWYRVKQIPIPSLIEIMAAAIPTDIRENVTQ